MAAACILQVHIWVQCVYVNFLNACTLLKLVSEKRAIFMTAIKTARTNTVPQIQQEQILAMITKPGYFVTVWYCMTGVILFLILYFSYRGGHCF